MNNKRAPIAKNSDASAKPRRPARTSKNGDAEPLASTAKNSDTDRPGISSSTAENGDALEARAQALAAKNGATVRFFGLRDEGRTLRVLAKDGRVFYEPA